MKTKSKALLMMMCAVLLVATSIMGTLAYLTDKDGVTNTFTVGSVGLKLDEADVKTDGTKDTDARVQENEYHLLPGHTYIKDPTVTVDANSEDAYVRMIVEVKNINQLKQALTAAKYYHTDGTFLLQMLCVDEDGNGTWDADAWKMQGYNETTETDGSTTGIYEFRYKEIVKKSTTETKLEPLFTQITVPSEVNNTQLACLGNVQIVVTAHAIQADGFENDEDGAWAAFGTQNP